MLARAPKTTPDDLGTEFMVDEANSPLRPTLAKLEGEYVRRVLDEVRGDRVAAAKILGVSVCALQRRFKEIRARVRRAALYGEAGLAALFSVAAPASRSLSDSTCTRNARMCSRGTGSPGTNVSLSGLISRPFLRNR